MIFSRERIIYRIVSFLFALHILNFSIDSPDISLSWGKEDLSFNDIESLVEFFAEKILHFDDTFPEYDEHGDEDTKRMSLEEKIDVFINCFSKQSQIFAQDFYHSYSFNGTILRCYLDIDSPPPKI